MVGNFQHIAEVEDDSEVDNDLKLIHVTNLVEEGDRLDDSMDRDIDHNIELEDEKMDVKEVE